mmetsp:Transcript_18244/g.29719  ORF Transcript_18244/g.29719 Transcript_18244/m.29719 type:complete len:135 (-) Transcript_18244:73-477(-)
MHAIKPERMQRLKAIFEETALNRQFHVAQNLQKAPTLTIQLVSVSADIVSRKTVKMKIFSKDTLNMRFLLLDFLAHYHRSNIRNSELHGSSININDIIFISKGSDNEAAVLAAYMRCTTTIYTTYVYCAHIWTI